MILYREYDNSSPLFRGVWWIKVTAEELSLRSPGAGKEFIASHKAALNHFPNARRSCTLDYILFHGDYP